MGGASRTRRHPPYRVGIPKPLRCSGTDRARPRGLPAALPRHEQAIPEALQAMGLFDLEYAADRRFSELSGGEAQRLMLARAVCSHPDVLLVDEPTAQLDTRTAASVSEVLGNLAGQGMIVVVATHDPRARDACDRIIDLADYAPVGAENADGDAGESAAARVDGDAAGSADGSIAGSVAGSDAGSAAGSEGESAAGSLAGSEGVRS